MYERQRPLRYTSEILDRAEAYDTQQSRLTDAREADRALLGDFTTFLDDCPTGHLDSLAHHIDDLDQTLGGIGTALGKARRPTLPDFASGHAKVRATTETRELGPTGLRGQLLCCRPPNLSG